MPQQHIEDLFEDKARKGDGSFAIAFALMQIARHQKSLAYQVQSLGLGNAASPMGATEFLATSVRDVGDAISSALQAIADRDD